MKTKFRYLIIIVISVLLSSCFDTYDTDECDYTNCNTTYPNEGTMTVKVSESEDGVPIEIYEGFYDTGILLDRDTIYSYEKDYLLAPQMYYTVVAEYESNGNIIHVVDGGRIIVQSKKVCDSTCYTVRDLTVNVKKKY